VLNVQPDTSTLSAGVAAAILAAALLHASWNALIKGAGDKGLYTLLLHACSGAIGLIGLMFTGLPAADSWPYAGTSALLHTLYIAGLMRAYEGGQLAVSYVLMRGLPPLLIALVATTLLGETLGWAGMAGVLCISAGVLSMGALAGQALRHVLAHPSAQAALWNVLAIVAYSLVDGQGARKSVNPLAYAFLLCALEPLIILTINWHQRSSQMKDYFRTHWRIGLLGALCSTTGYATVLWAMTQAPIAMVAALRECSVIFVVLIGSLWFGEGRLRHGLLAGTFVLTGLVLMRL
jgi:drug/metabolite transporter (DMT)-like permease